MNEANSNAECPSCHVSMGVDADYSADGSHIIYNPARDESKTCGGCGTVVCVDCAVSTDACKLCEDIPLAM